MLIYQYGGTHRQRHIKGATQLLAISYFQYPAVLSSSNQERFSMHALHMLRHNQLDSCCPTKPLAATQFDFEVLCLTCIPNHRLWLNFNIELSWIDQQNYLVILAVRGGTYFMKPIAVTQVRLVRPTSIHCARLTA